MTIKFVGLHAHSVAGSLFDAIGYPQAHMDFAYENGSDALALTDHGNMNGLAYQVLHAKKMHRQRVKILNPFLGWKHILFHPLKNGTKNMKRPWPTRSARAPLNKAQLQQRP